MRMHPYVHALLRIVRLCDLTERRDKGGVERGDGTLHGPACPARMAHSSRMSLAERRPQDHWVASLRRHPACEYCRLVAIVAAMAQVQRPLIIQSQVIRLCCPRTARRASNALSARGSRHQKLHTRTVTDRDISDLASLPLYPITLADLVK